MITCSGTFLLLHHPVEELIDLGVLVSLKKGRSGGTRNKMESYFSTDTGDSANFQKEISNMMHGFGDNPNPNPATVVLVESIVLQQLRSVLQEALKISEIRGKKTITNYEIIFLMRKNIMKLKQLQDYQLSLENIDKKTSSMGLTEEELLYLDDESNPKLRQRRTHIEIIEDLDELDEVEHIKVNTVSQIRKLRASKLSEQLPLDKYEAYHKARCASFRSNATFNKGFSKLEKWVNPNKDLRLTILALEVLGFIAYETVAEIVDSVYLIRQDAKKKPGDPFSKFEGGFFCNPGALQNAVYVKSGYEGFTAITVAEVREVVRRYFMPGGGMDGLFSRNMSQDIPIRFIAF